MDLLQSLSDLDTDFHSVTHVPSIHEKTHPRQGLILVITVTITGFQHQHAYSVRNKEGHEEKFTDADWADWDQQGRLVLAGNGKIFALAVDAIGKEPPQELIDLNANKPEAIKTPDWAKTWRWPMLIAPLDRGHIRRAESAAGRQHRNAAQAAGAFTRGRFNGRFCLVARHQIVHGLYNQKEHH